MKRKNFYSGWKILMAIPLMSVLTFISCKEDIDYTARYVFKGNTIISYLKKHPDSYSEYVDLLYKVPVSPLSDCTVGQLLSARGNYTVFAPTNEAIQNFLDTLAKEAPFMTGPSWDAFTDSTKLDSIRTVIVKNSILDSGDNGYAYMTSQFPLDNGGEFGTENMNDRKLTVYYSDRTNQIFINKDCPINENNQDIILLNGYIHQVDKVIVSSDRSVSYYLKNVIEDQQEGYLVMARAIQACGLLDTLSAVRDEVYEKMYQSGQIKDYQSHDYLAAAPKHRLLGYTIFAETDDFWREQGLDPQAPDLIPKLVQWIQDQHQYSDDDVFTTDNQYTSPENLLYQWTTYHILPMRLSADKLVIHHNEIGYSLKAPGLLGNPVMEYYSSFGKRRLIKLYESKESNGVYLNRFPKLDKGRRGTGHEISCETDKQGIRVNKEDPRAVLSDIQNACIYPISTPLSYNDETRNNLMRERIRFDIMALFPEAMTNDIRNKKMTNFSINDDQFVTVPQHQTYDYFKDLWLSDESWFRYANAYGFGWDNYQGDELLIYGRYDARMRFPPVPRRTTYEVRIGYIALEGRGVAQCYFGTNPDALTVTGIPMNMELNGNSFESGWEPDSEDDDYNSEVDKRMHTQGFMKGAMSICPMGQGPSSGARHDPETIRRIVTKTTMDPEKDYYLELKSVLDSETRNFVLDYLEICPKEIYDNPDEPEDIW